jgi:hypothetical protein
MLALGCAGAASLLVTRFTSRFIVTFLPLSETSARRRHEWLGTIGTAIFPIDRKFGMLSVRDQTGELFQIPCRLDGPDGLDEGENLDAISPISKGDRAQVVAYDASDRIFHVVACRPDAGESDLEQPTERRQS